MCCDPGSFFAVECTTDPHRRSDQLTPSEHGRQADTPHSTQFNCNKASGGILTSSKLTPRWTTVDSYNNLWSNHPLVFQSLSLLRTAFTPCDLGDRGCGQIIVLEVGPIAFSADKDSCVASS